MSVQTAFGAYLLSSTGVLASVAIDEQGHPAIYPKRGLQDSQADPYIIWDFQITDELLLVGGPPDVVDATATLHCFSKIYDNAQAVALAVHTFFFFLALPVAMSSYTLLGSWVKSTRDEDASDIGVYDVVVEVGLQIKIS